MEFMSVVLLRMVLPVDVLSYALGFFSDISLWRYTTATIIGIAPFAFIFAYAGDALTSGKYIVFAALFLLVLLFSFIGFRYFKK